MLKVGDIAPDFSLESNNGDTISLKEFQGKKSVVLIFYPGDMTPGCTQQLCEVRDNYTDFGKVNAVVFGVNPANRQSHQKFVDKHNYQFPLLVDQDKRIAKAFGVDGLFVKRTVFVIGPDGKITFAQKGKPSVKEILANVPN